MNEIERADIRDLTDQQLLDAFDQVMDQKEYWTDPRWRILSDELDRRAGIPEISSYAILRSRLEEQEMRKSLDGATRAWDAAQAHVDVLLARVEKLERERDALEEALVQEWRKFAVYTGTEEHIQQNIADDLAEIKRRALSGEAPAPGDKP